MKIENALRILNECGLICEFQNTVLSRDQLLRVLKRLNPNFDPENDVRKKNQMRHNKEMITLKPNYLDGTNLGPKQFVQKMQAYGWNVLGYGYNQIVLAKSRETLDTDSMKFAKWDKLKELQGKLKNLYIRFSKMDPAFVKRVGFRGINDLNIDWDDPEKRDDSKKFNERHVYMFSLEHLIKSVGKLNPEKILKKIYDLADYGPGFGRYAYFIRLPSSVKVYQDSEMKNDRSFGNSAVFTTQTILPQWIIGSFNTAIQDPRDEILHYLGLDDLVQDEPQDLTPELSQDEIEKTSAESRKSIFLSSITDKTDNKIVNRLQELVKGYAKDKMIIYDPINKIKEYFSYIGIREGKYFANRIYMVFVANKDGSYEHQSLEISINRDGDSATLIIPSEVPNRSSEIQKSDELKRFLADPEVVKCAEVYTTAKYEQKYDPRNRDDNRLFPSWD